MSEAETSSAMPGSSQKTHDCGTPTRHLNDVAESAPNHMKELQQQRAEVRSTSGEQLEEWMADQEDAHDTEADVLGESTEDLIQKFLASRSRKLKKKHAYDSSDYITIPGPSSAGKSRMIDVLLSRGLAEQERTTTTVASTWPLVGKLKISFSDSDGPLLRNNMDILVDPPEYDSAKEVGKTQDVKQLVRQRIKELEELRRKKTNRSF